MQPSTGPISSSMAIALSGAVLGAAARLTDKLKRAAAVMLEGRADDVELFDGQSLVRGVPGKSRAVGQVAQFMMGRPDLRPEGLGRTAPRSDVRHPPDRTSPDGR